MKIAIVCEKLSAIGGVEKYAFELVRRLSLRGNHLRVYCQTIHPSARLISNWPVVEVGRFPLRGIIRDLYSQLALCFRAKRADADLIIGFIRSPCLDVYRAGGGCHRLYSKLLPWWKRYSLKNLLELCIEQRLLRRGASSVIVANCTTVAKDLTESYSLEPKRIHILYTPVDANIHKPSLERNQLRSEVAKRYCFAPQAPILLFTSLGHRRKGLDTMIQALERVPAATLLIVGNPLSSRYKRLIKILNLGHRVCAVGQQTSVVPFYQVADWFVHPTVYDPYANTVLQSMACALPGIISSRDGASEHIVHGSNGFVLKNPEDPNELAELLGLALAMDSKERLLMGTRARDTVLPFTWERHVNEWENLLTDALEKRGSRQSMN